MKPVLVSKPVVWGVLILLIAQLACAASSISPSPTPPTLAAPSQASQPTQSAATQIPPASSTSGAQSTQAVPNTGGGATQSAPGGNPQAVLQAAVQHYQAVGRDQALKDFTDKKPPFDSEGLYLICLGTDHKITALSGLPFLVGISADTLGATNGQSLGALIWDAAALAPQGSIPFHWKNPLTGQQESKMLDYQKLDQDVCGVISNNP